MQANLKQDLQVIHEERPHVTIDLDLAAMSVEERREAAGLLQSAMNTLAGCSTAAQI